MVVVKTRDHGMEHATIEKQEARGTIPRFYRWTCAKHGIHPRHGRWDRWIEMAIKYGKEHELKMHDQ